MKVLELHFESILHHHTLCPLMAVLFIQIIFKPVAVICGENVLFPSHDEVGILKLKCSATHCVTCDGIQDGKIPALESWQQICIKPTMTDECG